MYTIIVHNKQGASDIHKASTKAEIDGWLDGWRDPQNLTAVVRDCQDRQVGAKAMGVKRIKWLEMRGRPSLSGETGERYQVTIPPSVEAKIRAHGEGSLSRGIIKLAKKLRDNQPG